MEPGCNYPVIRDLDAAGAAAPVKAGQPGAGHIAHFSVDECQTPVPKYRMFRCPRP